MAQLVKHPTPDLSSSPMLGSMLCLLKKKKKNMDNKNNNSIY